MIDPYENLANGIILLAVSDYRRAMKRGHQEMQADIERFFPFQLVWGVDCTES